MSNATSSASNIVRALLDATDARPDRVALRFVGESPDDVTALTRAQLVKKAAAVHGLLHEQGLRPGDRAVLMYPPGLDFVAAYCGATFAGVVPAPVPPPNYRRLERTLPRLLSAIRNCRPSALLTTTQIATLASGLSAMAPDFGSLRLVATDVDGAPERPARIPAGDDLALLQYTSGSTRDPRGVMVTHANMSANLATIIRVMDAREHKRGVSWLPMFHDMGLIGFLLVPLQTGAESTFMSPLTFLRSPRRWLEEMTRWQATTTGGPNFAFDLVNRAIARTGTEGLDLSHADVFFNAAEPVRARTLDVFAEQLAPCGLKRGALFTCYGLAEATLLATSSVAGQGIETTSLSAASLERGTLEKTTEGPVLVSSGAPRDADMLLVDPESLRVVSDGTVGEIWIQGASVASGYFDDPKLTDEVFRAHTADGRGPYLRTGDLGAKIDGQVFVTGRLKDLIIVNGVNHYPQDVEHTVEGAHVRVRPACVAVAQDERLGGVVVFAEIERRSSGRPPPADVLQQRVWPALPEHHIETTEQLDYAAMASAIRKAVAKHHDLPIAKVVLLKAGSLPKTTSGKIQRRRCAMDLVSGDLQALSTDP